MTTLHARTKATAAAIFLLATGAVAAATPARAFDNVVTVTGEAELSATPDAAKIQAGVVTVARTAREASDANSKAMAAVLASLKKDGIAERDIQTARLSLQPMRAPGRGVDGPITSFQAINQVSVTLRDIAQVPALLDRLIEAGANDIGGISFAVTEPGKLLDDLRAAAVADARRKAAIYATAAGGKLGPALAISEAGGGAVPYFKTGAVLRQAAVPIAPGAESLRVSVTVTFALMP